MSQTSETGTEKADFLFDTEELHALADGELIRKALRHAHDKRVTRVAFYDGELVQRGRRGQ